MLSKLHCVISIIFMSYIIPFVSIICELDLVMNGMALWTIVFDTTATAKIPTSFLGLFKFRS